MAKKSSDSNGKNGKGRRVEKRVPIAFRVADAPKLAFANHLIVQHDPSCFYLWFFEALPPMLLGSEEEVAKQLESIETIPAQCAARVVIPANKMQSFVDVLTGNLTKYKASIEKQQRQKSSE
ncbi:MAG: DUF3467 domain-containing protein [Planctomycetia bacterium]|nr:DUF3467 domain-containing protein [Planctomycetia bacterium]